MLNRLLRLRQQAMFAHRGGARHDMSDFYLSAYHDQLYPRIDRLISEVRAVPELRRDMLRLLAWIHEYEFLVGSLRPRLSELSKAVGAEMIHMSPPYFEAFVERRDVSWSVVVWHRFWLFVDRCVLHICARSWHDDDDPQVSASAKDEEHISIPITRDVEVQQHHKDDGCRVVIRLPSQQSLQLRLSTAALASQLIEVIAISKLVLGNVGDSAYQSPPPALYVQYDIAVSAEDRSAALDSEFTRCARTRCQPAAAARGL